jgi:hypothetical protein
MTAGQLQVGAGGKVTGPATIEYNNPFPCVNGTPGGGSSSMMGVVMHTMVGNLPGTITVFNESGFEASAFFGVDQNGKIHQFGPIGQNWEAWAQVSGNSNWYSIEFADDGNPNNPLTAAQLTAGAQLVELLSRFAGFPLQITNSVSTPGLGVHSMGGASWGGHTCPDSPPSHVRSGQRAAMLSQANDIRSGVVHFDAPPGLSVTPHDGFCNMGWGTPDGAVDGTTVYHYQVLKSDQSTIAAESTTTDTHASNVTLASGDYVARVSVTPHGSWTDFFSFTIS